MFGLQRTLTPGLVVMAGIALVAIGIGILEERVITYALIEPLVIALLIGVIVRNAMGALALPFLPGAGYAGKQILEVSVALLGASVDLRQMIAGGAGLLLIVVLGVAGGIVVSYLIGRALGLGDRLAILVAVGNSICGNSAIAAVAPVIRADKKEIASAIALTAVLGVGMVIGLPLLVPALALSNYQYGVLAGMSVYAVPQVVAAAFPVSLLSGEVATLVKLSRVMLLGPVVLVFALLFRGGEAKRGIGTYLPWFAALFLLFAALRSTGILPEGPALVARDIARLLTVLAMAGLGFGVEIAAIRQVGPRVAVAVVASLAFMAVLTLVLMRVLAIA